MEMEYLENKTESDVKVCAQGEEGDSFYIIDKGTADVIVDGEKKRELTAGRGFGETSLLYNKKSTKTIVAKPHSGFWRINRKKYRESLSKQILTEYDIKLEFVQKADIFAALTPEQKQEVTNFAEIKTYQKGMEIFKQNTQSQDFYILIEGVVVLMSGSYEIKKLLKGDWFGEEALYPRTMRNHTARAFGGPCKCIEIPKARLQNVIGDSLEFMIYRNIQRNAIRKSAIGSKLTELQIEKIADLMEIKKYHDGEVVLRKGSKLGMKLFILLEGEHVQTSKTEKIVAYRGTLFGAGYLLSATGAEFKHTEDDYVIEGDGIISEIFTTELTLKLGGTIEQLAAMNERSHERGLQDNASTKIAKKDLENFKLQDFNYIKTLGSGHFGKVYLVRQKDFKHFFALKCISKELIYKEQIQDLVQEEKEVLETVNYPFIVQFMRTFKDSHFIYLLEEYLKGLELGAVIHKLGILTPKQTRFYIGCYILSIEYLHRKNIIYRDLKPQNTIVEENGYPKLIDMGVAKIMKDKANRTFTFLGTPMFVAPEIIQGGGYDKNVDLWSIGVCMYRFLTGKYPFYSDSDDPKEIYEQILKKELKIPAHLDFETQALLRQLLSRQPEARLGGSFQNLKNHEWFEDFDWDQLYQKKLKPPYTLKKEDTITDEELIQINEDAIPIADQIQKDYQVSPAPTNGSSKFKSYSSNGQSKVIDEKWEDDF